MRITSWCFEWPANAMVPARRSAAMIALHTACTGMCFLTVAACTPDVRETARRGQCEHQLLALHGELITHVKKYGDIPRDERGVPALKSLGHSGAVARNKPLPATWRCPGAARAECAEYTVNPRLRAEDLAQKSKTIVACDRCSNHLLSNGKPTAVALLGHGSTVLMRLSVAEQEEWRALFAAGDEKAGVVRIIEDNDGIEVVMWYLGENKGYVKNQ
jgi:hypothetical protein